LRTRKGSKRYDQGGTDNKYSPGDKTAQGSPKADRIRVEAPEPEQKERRDPKKGVSGSEVAVQLAGVGYGAAGYSRQQRERG